MKEPPLACQVAKLSPSCVRPSIELTQLATRLDIFFACVSNMNPHPSPTLPPRPPHPPHPHHTIPHHPHTHPSPFHLSSHSFNIVWESMRGIGVGWWKNNSPFHMTQQSPTHPLSPTHTQHPPRSLLQPSTLPTSFSYPLTPHFYTLDTLLHVTQDDMDNGLATPLPSPPPLFSQCNFHLKFFGFFNENSGVSRTFD